MIHLREAFRTGKPIETESPLVVVRSCREEIVGSNCLMDRFSLWSDKNVFELDIDSDRNTNCSL
jgi:hypothetical protein